MLLLVNEENTSNMELDFEIIGRNDEVTTRIKTDGVITRVVSSHDKISCISKILRSFLCWLL